MKFVRVVSLALFGVLLAQQACAADWRGFYLGGNLGYGFGSAANSLGIADGPVTKCHFCDNIIVLGPTIDHLVAQDAGSPNLKPQGFSGGIQFGYNQQAANWVYGVEAEFGAFHQRGNDTTSVVLPGNTAFGGPGTGVCGTTGAETCIGNFSTKLRTDWLLTFRPRVGYVFGDTLVFGTAGVAITRMHFEQTYSDNITNPFIGGATGAGGSVQTSASAWRAGWIVGAGFEHALRENWSIKAEYLYMRFAGISAAGHLTGGIGDFADFSNGVDHVSFNLVRLGLNKKFGG